MGFPGGSVVKSQPATAGGQETWVRSLGCEIPWRRKWKPTPIFSPGKSHGQRSLAGHSPRRHKELGTTEWLKASLSVTVTVVGPLHRQFQMQNQSGHSKCWMDIWWRIEILNEKSNVTVPSDTLRFGGDNSKLESMVKKLKKHIHYCIL